MTGQSKLAFIAAGEFYLKSIKYQIAGSICKVQFVTDEEKRVTNKVRVGEKGGRAAAL